MIDQLPAPPPFMAAAVEGIALKVEGIVGANPHVGTQDTVRVYRMRRDPSHRPQYVVARGPRAVALGERDLFVQPLQDLEVLRQAGPGHFERPALARMAKEHGLPVDRKTDEGKEPLEPEELVASLEELHRDVDRFLFLEEVAPYGLDVLLELGEDLPGALDLALRGGWGVDEDLAFAFRPLLAPVDPALVPPRVAMRTAPNEIQVTGTKAGKSSIAARLGRRVERPTPAGLLGFADSEKRHHGVLHRASRAVLVDEVAQEPQEEAARALSTYLEVGEVEIPRGIGLQMKGWAPVAFLANPPPGTEGFASALESFLAVLRALTSTQAEALGSRMGLLLFKPATRPASAEEALEGIQLAKAEALVASFQVHVAPLTSQALQDERVVRWLTQGFPDAHVARIRAAATRVVYPEVAAFLRGYAEGSRHARGVALRTALVDTAPLHLEEGEVRVQPLLLRADEVWERVVALREESLQELVHVAGDEEIRREQLRTRYLALPFAYLKRALGAIALWARGQEEGLVEAPVPLDTVRETYLASPLWDREGSRRLTWPAICRTLERNLNVATELAEPFGLRFAVGQYGVEVRVRDTALFREAARIIGGMSEIEGGTEGGAGPRGDGGDGGDGTPELGTKSPSPPEGSRGDGGDGTRSTTGVPAGTAGTVSAGDDNNLARKSVPVVPVVPAIPEGDILRAVKLGDRGYGVPKTAIAHRLAQDLETDLRQVERAIEQPLLELLGAGRLREARPGVFRLPGGEG